MDRLTSIAAFLSVAEQGGFARAARELGVSASAVSKGVSRLERRLGLRLLNRTTRALSLTDEGREFRDRCAPALAELDAAESAMRERAAATRGLLRVGLPAALGRLTIVPALRRLAHRHPELRVEASCSDRLVDMVEAGLDAVVRIGELRDSSLVARRVGTVRYIVCGAPSYLAGRSPVRTLDDLSGHDCLRRVPHPCSPAAAWKFASPSGDHFDLAVSGSLSLDSNDALIDAALSGAGLVQLHTYMAEPHLRSGRLVQVLADHAVDGPPVSVVYPSHRHLAPKVRAFIDFVAEAMTEGRPATSDEAAKVDGSLPSTNGPTTRDERPRRLLTARGRTNVVPAASDATGPRP